VFCNFSVACCVWPKSEQHSLASLIDGITKNAC
jgi:hypothetical protein